MGQRIPWPLCNSKFAFHVKNIILNLYFSHFVYGGHNTMTLLRSVKFVCVRSDQTAHPYSVHHNPKRLSIDLLFPQNKLLVNLFICALTVTHPHTSVELLPLPPKTLLWTLVQTLLADVQKLMCSLIDCCATVLSGHMAMLDLYTFMTLLTYDNYFCFAVLLVIWNHLIMLWFHPALPL